MSNDGLTKLEVLGDSGEHCLKLNGELERQRGKVVGERQYKSEFKESEQEQETESEEDR
jgi:hypothetical protein